MQISEAGAVDLCSEFVEENLLERLELTAIIYEYSNIYGIALAHPLTDLLPDGTFHHA